MALLLLKLGLDMRQVMARFEAGRQALTMMHRKTIQLFTTFYPDSPWQVVTQRFPVTFAEIFFMNL